MKNIIKNRPERETLTISLLFSFLLMPFCFSASAKSFVFNAVVASDGTGGYSSVQAAVDAAPSNLKSPWLIFVKNGSYEELVVIPVEKPFIHLIGQDREKTIIHKAINAGGKPDANSKDSLYWQTSIHNPASPVYKKEGSVVTVNGADFYSENISYVNDFGVDNRCGPMALAMFLNINMPVLPIRGFALSYQKEMTPFSFLYLNPN